MNFMHRNFGLFLIFGSSFYCVSGCVSFFSFSFYFAFPCGSHTFFFCNDAMIGLC